jgi:membrane fusion protein, multidrug efflux system
MLSCSDDKKQLTPVSNADINTIDTVDVIIAKQESIQKELTLPAELLPYERTTIYAKVPAYVKEIKVDIGSRVIKGQLLATLEAPEINAKVAELASNVQTTLARMQNSKDMYKRLQGGQNSGAVSMREIEQTANQWRADSTVYLAAQKTLMAAKQQQQYLIIYAPFSGVITKRTADVGALVGTNSAMPLLELENNNQLRLRVAVPEFLVGNTLVNNDLSFKVKALPNKTFNSKLTRKSEKIDSQTRSELWEFTVDNSNHDLKVGMFADAKLKFARPQAVITLPPSAVVTTLERRFVIRISDGVTEWVDVSLGTGVNDKVEVFGSIGEGDMIVRNGNEELKSEKKIAVRLPGKK